MNPGDEEEAWRQIVENYGERPSLDEAAGSDPLPEERSSDLLEPDDPEPPQQWSEHVIGLPQQPAWVHSPDPWEDEGRFVPPTPPPIPLAEPKRLLAWAGIFLAPVLVLIGVIFPINEPRWLTGLLIAWFVGGFVYLVITMPGNGRDPWDDGARI